MKISATCAFGTESVLKKELRDLGYEILSSSDGLLTVSGDERDLFRLNMSLRCANRVMINMTAFRAESFDGLFDGVKALPWEEFVPPDGRFWVEKITSVRSKLFSKSDCQRIIKKAMADRLLYAHRRNVLPETGGSYPVRVRIRNDECTVFLDTSGEGLNRRGYRLNKGEAPLMETLAAAVLYLSGYDGTLPFADPMCGSGTIAIEAAMIARGIAPGAARSFLMESWYPDRKRDFALMREEAASGIRKAPCRIYASDIDVSRIRDAMKNAERCSVKDDIAFQKMDFRQFTSGYEKGIMITNPPYGERLGDRKETEGLYRDLGELMKHLPGWKLGVICANPDFQRYFGRKADRNRKLYNGNMLSYLYTYLPESGQNHTRRKE